jgi:2-C-methyl-D-erythritol 2,4-cyclodiphosphate synthase
MTISDMRVGQGWDRHRLATLGAVGGAAGGSGAQMARPMVIGGVAFPTDLNPVAHSDGDALLHAITDAILGAIGAPDIGQLFPDKDARWAGASSDVFLREAVKRAASEGWRVGNVDATVVVERPKLGARKDEVRASVARVLGVEVSRVNVKGKTPELLDPMVGGQVIEAYAVVLLVR